MTESPLTRADVYIELERLAGELYKATTEKHKAEIKRLIDKWLDERLIQKGAHAPECGCDDCAAHVADALARRLGEATNGQDNASVAEWGAGG